MIKKILNRLIDKFIGWGVRTAMSNSMVNSNDEVNAIRYHPFWPDEYWCKGVGLVNARPWYLPFNILVHNWVKGDQGDLHSHPRWSITILLRGVAIEETPTGLKWLTPGSIVFRRSSAIHRMVIPRVYEGKTWTIFIVGRRRKKQNYYTPSGELVRPYPADHLEDKNPEVETLD